MTTQTVTQQDETPLHSNVLGNVITNHGLVVIETKNDLDVRPFSQYITSALSTGGVIGNQQIPLSENTLFVEGTWLEEKLAQTMAVTMMYRNAERIHYLSFPTINSPKEAPAEGDISLNNQFGRDRVTSMVTAKGAEVVIIHTLATSSNYFFAESEKNVLLFLRDLTRSGVAVIVFAESGTKGMSTLRSMADFILSISQIENGYDAPISVRCEKCPACEIDKPKPFCLSLSKEPDGRMSVTHVQDPELMLETIILLMAQGKTQATIGEVYGIPQYKISRYLSRAEEDGLITKIGRKFKLIRNKR